MASLRTAPPRRAAFWARASYLSDVNMASNTSGASRLGGTPPMAINLNINGKAYAVNAAPETPLLWVLRDELQLTGTKYGCGIAQCGACTVHANGAPTRSCLTA